MTRCSFSEGVHVEQTGTLHFNSEAAAALGGPEIAPNAALAAAVGGAALAPVARDEAAGLIPSAEAQTTKPPTLLC